MKQKLLTKSGFFLAALFCMLNVQPLKAQFTKGNLVILRVGNDTNAVLTSSATATYLDQITTAGAKVNTFAIPVAGTERLTMSGTSTSEGQITRTADGKRIIVAGYDTAVGKISVSNTPSATTARVVNEIISTAVMKRATKSNTFQSSNSMRSAASTGLYYWTAGGGSGTTYYGTVDTPAVLQNTINNTRVINAYNGNLYFSTASTSGSGAGIYQVGTGFPRVSGQTLTPVVLTGTTSSPYAFSFNATGTVLYVADDRTAAGAGVLKYTKVGGSFTLAYTIALGTGIGARGLCVDFAGTVPVIYATTTDNKVVKIIDGGATSTAAVIFTAQKNAALRGIQFAPITSTCVKPSKPGAISGPTKGICAGSYRFSIAPVANATSYRWTKPALSTIAYDSGTIIRINVTSTFRLDSISVLAVNSCGTSLKTSLVLSSTPAKPVIAGPNCVTANQIGVVYKVTTPTSANNIYKWTVPAGAKITSGQQTPTITVTWGTVAGRVTMRESNRCLDTIYAVPINVTVGNCTIAAREINSEIVNSGINIYPNPTARTAYFTINATKQDEFSIILTDLSGKQVAIKAGTLLLGKNTISMNVANLKSGIYLANVRTSDNRSVIKMVKL